MFRRQVFPVPFVLVLLFSISAQAEVTRDQAARLGVDVVLTRGGGEVRGSIVSRAEDGSLTMAVRREWLGDRQPQRLADEEQQEKSDRIAGYKQLAERIRNWLRDVDDESELHAILQRELETYSAYVGDPDSIPQAEPSEFLLFKVDGGDVRRVFAQPAQRKQAALVAWREQVPDVETRNYLELQEALEARDVDWRTTRVDLSDRLPSGLLQSDEEWAARKAVYDFAFRDRIEFQGTGDVVFRTGADAQQPAMEQLLGGLLNNGGLNTDLNQLLGGNGAAVERPGWRESAIKGTENADAIGCRVTRVDTDLQNSRVTVETVFLARVDDDSWAAIWRHQETLDAKEKREALTNRIKQDPQVAESLKLLESLGLKDGVAQAVQFGAATMEAQQSADDRFFEFFDRYTERLDGPPLRWAEMQPE